MLAMASDPNNEYVRDVLLESEKDQWATDDGNDQSQDQQEEARRLHQLEEEELKKSQENAEHERRAQERDAAFEKKLLKLDREEQKKARRKKKKDSALVSRLLKASEEGDYYAALGLSRRYSLSRWIPKWLRNLSSLSNGKLGGFVQISTSDIRKAYRNMATLVHPDKNHDGRSEQAFMALDEAYNLLSDPMQREEYDEVWSEQSLDRWQNRQSHLYQAMHGTKIVVSQTAGMVRKVVGPFAVPISILAVVFL